MELLNSFISSKDKKMYAQVSKGKFFCFFDSFSVGKILRNEYRIAYNRKVKSKKAKRMDWIDRMEIAYEAMTDRMIDEMYAPRSIECAQCREYFSSDDSFEAAGSDLDFCSESCADSWEEEFAFENEEGECTELDNQLSIHPVICTSIQTTIQKEGVPL